MPQSPFTFPLLAVYLHTGSALAIIGAFGAELFLRLADVVSGDE